MIKTIAHRPVVTFSEAHKAEKIEEMLNKSLAELGTDTVDIFYLHAADRSIPFTEPLKKLNELHKQGKFVNLGLSNFTAAEVAEVQMHCHCKHVLTSHSSFSSERRPHYSTVADYLPLR